jgi:hypothetical protein
MRLNQMTMPKAKSVMKQVGRRKPYSGGLAGLQGFFELCLRLRGNRPFLPRGVYRFNSHEEADAWTMKMLTRAKVAPPP